MTSIHYPSGMEHILASPVHVDVWTSAKHLSLKDARITTVESPTAVSADTEYTLTVTSPSTTMATTTPLLSPSETLTAVHSEATTLSHTPGPSKGQQQDIDQDAVIWQVLVDLDRFVVEARKDHVLLAAEIEDQMSTLEGHCHQLGLDPANITHLLVFPCTAPITLTTRQALHRACDDLYQDILRRKERIERWVSRIITIAENIRESPEQYLETTMPPMSRARILQLERTYRTLEKEWMERLQRFQSMVGMLRIRWDQCAYIPADDYDHALCKLFQLAELENSTMEPSYLQIEAPLCLSKECLSSLSIKLVELDQNFYTRQSRIRAMEHVLGLIYQDLGTSTEKRVAFRSEATVRYAAELGRELKALQLELTARKLYQSGEHWNALSAVWDSCLVSEQERESFRSTIEQDDVTFMEKLDRIQTEIENCHVRYSKSGAVYKLMMTRSSHIEKMISFEHTARDPKRLFQSSFQLVEEEKFRRRAYPTLLKLESTLIQTIEKFEKEQGESFMYEGAPYLETLQAEIEKRHVNETVFAKFTPKIAAPTRSQTIQIMGRPISPGPAPTISAPTPRPANASRISSSSICSLESKGRSSTLPVQTPSALSSSRESLPDLVKEQRNNAQEVDGGFASSLKSYLLSHQRGISGTSTTSVNSTHSLKSKSSASSLSLVSTSPSASVSTSNSPMNELVNGASSYFGSFSSSYLPVETQAAPQKYW
ncbi:microtubule associated protein-domain-containing protein [Gamsiella multidivaricata]|uniref:microtubule associated protein-domain-containing protein n=1 Tax=Gamsiella multidivaricata TaxID=101098 RepID=UPI00221F617B|nr:microtubule associated protein-domain-containing protein [Gamsiella multidivaricata]KAI7825223.1 microtubule associated protein-domain-containing protein [Gamsiella multidivaricata]